MKKKIIFLSIGTSFLMSAFMFIAYASIANKKENSQRNQVDSLPTFYEWKKACDILPHFNEYANNPCKTPLKERMFCQQIDYFFSTMKAQFEKIHWVDGSIIVPQAISSDHFDAYVEKIIVPSDAIVAIHGDFHGDVHAINRFIETFAKRGFLDEKDPFKIKHEKFYIIFLGDYVDRGWYGAEVIYTILRLKNENPDKVFMVRGNHEEIELNTEYGFVDEILKKFSSGTLLQKIGQLYNFLPLALYVGAGQSDRYDVIQCCHGGIEIGFDPGDLLNNSATHAATKINMLMQKKGFQHIGNLELARFERYFRNNKAIDTANGFMWSDFIVNPNQPLALSARDGYSGSIFEYGKQVTKQLLQSWSGESYQLRSIFRAHQHSCDQMYNRILNYDKLSHPSDAGVGKLWIEHSVHQQKPMLLDDVSVVTFSVAPETGYGWPYHAFAELHVAQNYSDWRLYVYRMLPNQH